MSASGKDRVGLGQKLGYGVGDLASGLYLNFFGFFLLYFLVDLGGLGIRDLAFDGDRLLVLAGPTMDLSGPLAVLAIDDPWGEADGLRQADGVGRLLCLPHGAGTDHAEGLTPLADGRLLVVFDSPDPARLPEGGRIKYADLYDLP